MDTAVVLARWGKGTWPGLWISLSDVQDEGVRTELARCEGRSGHRDPQLVHFFGGGGHAWCEMDEMEGFDDGTGGDGAEEGGKRRARAIQQAAAFWTDMQVADPEPLTLSGTALGAGKCGGEDERDGDGAGEEEARCGVCGRCAGRRHTRAHWTRGELCAVPSQAPEW